MNILCIFQNVLKNLDILHYIEYFKDFVCYIWHMILHQ